MRSIIVVAITLALASVAVSSMAATSGHTQFRWRDGAGEMHYADTLTPEALAQGYDVLDAKGAVARHVDRPRTAEELQVEQASAEAAATAKRNAELQAIRDERMLAAYPTEKDFVAARQAQLDSIDQNIRTATNSLSVQEKNLSDMLARAASVEHSGQQVPDSVKKQIESLRKTAETLRKYVARRQQERTDSAKTYDIDLEHYREVRSRGASSKP
jgi:hypothetical protein